MNTDRTAACPVVSPDGRHLYLTGVRSFAEDVAVMLAAAGRTPR